MFVTSQPGRIISAGTTTLSSSSTSAVFGKEGFAARIHILGEGCSLYAAGDKSHACGLSDGEIIEFSDLAEVSYSGESSAKVNYIIFDTI